MTFDEALEACRSGYNISRIEWGKAWVFYVPAETCQIPHKFGGGFPVMASLWMKTAEDTLVPWVCSQTEIMADDWEILGGTQRRLTQL